MSAANDPQADKARFLAANFGKVPKATTSSGIEIDGVYVPQCADRLGLPGEFPFTRGVHPTMYRGRPWTMRQYAGFGDAAATNARFHALLARGQTGLSVAFDLPTQMGYDPADALAEGEVGKVGVSIATLDDLDRLFDRIPLRDVSVSMTINATAAILLALTIALAKRRGVAPKELRGTVQNDVLKEYIARGTYRFPIGPAMKIATDVIVHCARELPRWNPISISGYHMREAGCTAAQEIAFTLANGCAYVRSALDAGLAVDDFASQLSFFFNAHNHFFEEVAKFRAARRMWAEIMRDRFGANDADSRKLRFHTQTAGSTLTAQQPDVNVVRVTLQALAAVLGGTQSLHTNGKDEALALPTEEAATLALRTQQVIALESGVTSTVDPLGGAPFVEALTDELEAKARELIAKIDSLGGSAAATEQGWIQNEIQRSAYQHQLAVERGDVAIVGVNRFAIEEPPPRVGRIDESLRAARVAEVEDVLRRRDGARARARLDEVVRAAESGANLLPALVDAVEAGVTLGEICGGLQGLFGRYRPAH